MAHPVLRQRNYRASVRDYRYALQANEPMQQMLQKGVVWVVERQLKSKYFQKCVSNTGEILGLEEWQNDRSKTDRIVATSFAHSSYERSGGNCMFLDLQGAKCEFVDVEIVISLVSETLFGTGILGVDSIRKFFKQHQCNYLCQSLNLSQHTSKTPEETVDSTSRAQDLRMSNVSDVSSVTADDLIPDAVDANSVTTELQQQALVQKKSASANEHPILAR